MGLDLQLLPIQMAGIISFSHSVLSLDRDSELFSLIRDIEEQAGRRVPEGFYSYVSCNAEYEEQHYGETLCTLYGYPLKYVTANYLKSIFAFYETESYMNNAVFNYVIFLPDEMGIALYWC